MSLYKILNITGEQILDCKDVFFLYLIKSSHIWPVLIPITLNGEI